MAIALNCPNCSARLNLGDEFAGQVVACLKCAQRVTAPEPALVSHAPDTEHDNATCPYCCEAIPRDAKKCKHCGEFLDRALREDAAPDQWKPGVAAVLSLFVPGAGQVYKTQIGAGLCWLVAVACGYFVLPPVGLLLHVSCVFEATRGNTKRY